MRVDEASELRLIIALALRIREKTLVPREGANN